VASWAAGADAEAGQKWLEGLARDVGELRSTIHYGKPLDTELAPWRMLESGIVEADRCTDSQLCLIESRAQRGHLCQAAVERRRRQLAKALGAPFNPRCLDEVRPELEKEAALLEVQARWARDKAQAQREYDERAARGAAWVTWPISGARKWPPVDSTWERHAQWFKMWRAQPPPCPMPAAVLRRSGSSSSLKSWLSVSDISWEEVESQAKDHGWEIVLDEATPEFDEVEEDFRNTLQRADLGEMKTVLRPPAGVALTMEVICLLLGESPSWESSRKLLADVKLLDRLVGLHHFLPQSTVEAVSPYIAREDFRPEAMAKDSVPCGSLCRWARALYKYHTVAHAKARAARAELAEKSPQELLDAAAAALDVLCIASVQELKAFAKPPVGVASACICLLHLFAGISPAVELTAKGRVKHACWKGVQLLMGNPGGFMQQLKSFKHLIDEGKVPPKNIQRARRIKDEMGETFDCQVMKRKSIAAAGLCVWIANIITYYDIAAPPAPEASGLACPRDPEPTTGQAWAPSALHCLSKSAIVELKSLAKPPQGVVDVCSACCLLIGAHEQAPDWKACKVMLADVTFLDQLMRFDPHAVSEETIDEVEAVMLQKFPDVAAMRQKSLAAGSLAQWVTGVVQLRRFAGRGGA